MINGNYRLETKTLLIDLAILPDSSGEYEAITMKKTGLCEELAIFRSYDFMEAVNAFIDMVNKYGQPERIQKKKNEGKPKKEAVNIYGVKVGDLFFDSWGYEQTNIDFYQVTALKGKTQVVLKAVNHTAIENGFLSYKVKAIKDSFKTGNYITHLQKDEAGMIRTVKNIGTAENPRIIAGGGRDAIYMTEWDHEYTETCYY